MSPREQKTIQTARRKIRWDRAALVVMIAWVAVIGVLVRWQHTEKKKMEGLILEDKTPYKERALRYSYAAVFVVLAGVIIGPHLVASPAERLLVKVLDEQEREGLTQR